MELIPLIITLCR